jgi:hypothetical protein
MLPDIYDEQRLLRLLVSGSEYAFARIFDRYHNRVYHTANSFLKSPTSAEEFQSLLLPAAGSFVLYHVINRHRYGQNCRIA